MAYFNLSTRAWRHAARAWRLPLSPRLWFQTWVKGGLQTGAAMLQTALMGERRAAAPTRGSVFVLGFWRSGTSLLHELLCADPRFGFPTTWACLNPHHFLLSQARVLAMDKGAKSSTRPQDKMVIRAGTPQEDEFGLFLSGARSPYEGILAPRRFSEALGLADPADLPRDQARRWQQIFLEFLKGLSLINDGRPLVLKSPTHSYRVPTLRRLLPDARFVLIVRNPFEVFESAVRTYRALTDKYGIGPGLLEGELRQMLLTERLRFEAKLESGIAGLPDNRLVIVRYEELVADPMGQLARLYAQLELPDFEIARAAIAAELSAKSGYEAQAELPDDLWTRRIAEKWADIFSRYGYARQTGAILPESQGPVGVHSR